MSNVTNIDQARTKSTATDDGGAAGLGYAAIEQVITATIVRVPAAAIDTDRDAVGYKDYTHSEISYVIVNRHKSMHYLAVPVGTEVELLATPMECAAAVVRGDPGRIRRRFSDCSSDRSNEYAGESAEVGEADSEREPNDTPDNAEE